MRLIYGHVYRVLRQTQKVKVVELLSALDVNASTLCRYENQNFLIPDKWVKSLFRLINLNESEFEELLDFFEQNIEKYYKDKVGMEFTKRKKRKISDYKYYQLDKGFL